MASEYVKCPLCSDYSWGTCGCKRYEIAQAWRGKVNEGDWQAVWGKDPGDLVEAWADDYDSGGDYTIVGGSPQEVWVRDEEEKITKWEVSGEAVPAYHATQLPAGETGAERGEG